ncbi:hypothetical protein, partial [Niallia taxi]|uniref:hypothetical protein n=1 Tax=Niallia taxi TaxID=2499688 RepID=UPI003009B7AB
MNKGKLFFALLIYHIALSIYYKTQPIKLPHKIKPHPQKNLVQFIPTPLAKFRIKHSRQLPYNQFVSDNKR